MSSSPNKLNSLQMARGIAALLVVLHHTTSHLQIYAHYLPFKGVFNFGHAGVDFFFVLSGFIIFHVHGKDIGQPARLGRYLIQRFTRIFPIYWLIIGLYVAAIYWPFPFTWQAFLLDLALLPMAKLATLGVAWTMRFEILFYVLFALAIASKRIGLTVLGVWLLCIVGRAVGWIPMLSPPWLDGVIAVWNFEFLFGIGAAYCVSRYRVAYPWLLLLLATVAFLLFGVFDNQGGLMEVADIAKLPYGVFSMLIILALVELERSGRFTPPAMLVAIGEASYSIYLSHLLLISLVFNALYARGSIYYYPRATFVLMLMAALLGGVFLSLSLEMPIIRWVRQRIYARS